MKLSPRNFRIEWDLHAWAGVVASLLSFVIFFFGAFALFVEDLRVWQDPALHAPESAPPSFDRLLEVTRQGAPLPPGSSVAFWRHEGTRLVQTFVRDGATGDRRTLWIDPGTGAAMAERSRLADELYEMHFFERLPRGKEVAGFVGVALLVALFSGLLIHLRALRRQWWRFRPRLRLRKSASDAHKVLGVFTLPFAAVVIWSGAILSLASVSDCTVASAAFDGDEQKVRALADLRPPMQRPALQAGPPLSVDQVVERAQAAHGRDLAPGYLAIRSLGAAPSTVRVDFPRQPFTGWPRLMLDMGSGEVLVHGGGERSPSQAFEHTLWDLHFGDYGGALLEILYALLALAGCAVIVTGNLIWLERRDPERARWSSRALERLTVGVCGGAVLGVAVAVLGNRLLPWELAGRPSWELRLLLWSWAAGIGLATVPRIAPRALAAALAVAAALAFAAVVAVDALTLEANLFTALALDLPAVLSVELLLCALALGCGATAWFLRPAAAAHKEGTK